MTVSRDNIRQILFNLIAKKDASVFQDPETFEKTILQLGNLEPTPDISALKAGLTERFPWELQKDADGIVTPITARRLAASLSQKHQIEAETALWAVETWGKALGLQVELPTPKPQPTESVEKLQQTSAPAAQKFEEPQFIPTRFGIIFGQDENSEIKVFKVWWNPLSEQESADLKYIPIKIETPKAKPLFTAPPKRKKKPELPNPQKVKTEIQLKKKIPEQKQPVVKAPEQPAPAPQPVTQVPASPPDISDTSAEGLFKRAVYLFPGGGGKVDVRTAQNLLKESVIKGSLVARRKFGEIYLKGIGVKQNLTNAAGWYKTAAEAGDAESQFQLGSLYQCGMGVEYSLEMAQLWLQRAAEQGHTGAQQLLNQILQA